MLVDAPAAIEEAVALLLATSDARLRHAACLTYIHRLYSAFLVTAPAALAEDFKAYHWLYDAGVGSGMKYYSYCDSPEYSVIFWDELMMLTNELMMLIGW